MAATLKGRWLFRGIVVLLLLVAGGAAAQSEAASLQALTVDLWPDYDRPDLLVLLTGTLPPQASLPATVSLPLPAGAELNAVARLDAEGVLVDDIEFTVAGDVLTLTTPDSRFRVEYYVPYAVEGDQRIASFNWLANLAVERMVLSAQQPAAASRFDLEPAAASVAADRGDGLTYHTLPEQSLPAGQPFTVRATYEMTSPQLTAGTLAGGAEQADAAAAVQPAPAAATNWPLIVAAAGGLLIAAAVVWQLLLRRQPVAAASKPKPRARRPRPVAKPAATARFCHNCGQPLSQDDRFCRHCGTAVKEL